MTEHGSPRFPPRGRKLVYVAIADVLAARIEDGTYPPDGRLPAEPDLVAEFGASRESVRRAVAELRERGLIETVKGKGSYVVPPEERARLARRPAVRGQPESIHQGIELLL